MSPLGLQPHRMADTTTVAVFEVHSAQQQHMGSRRRIRQNRHEPPRMFDEAVHRHVGTQ
jgi:hypothetical protein